MQIFEGQIRFGIHSGPQHISFSDYLDLWRTVEELGYEWASVYDHFLPIQADPEGPNFEGLTLLAALAAHTTRIRCGILVVGNTYRNPGVLANIAITIDHVSGGRLDLGLGAGWYEKEHDQFGIPLPPMTKRAQMLSETASILKSLWTQHKTTFKGRYYTITDALCEPKPVQKPHIPLWIGGMGERFTLRVVAEVADGWNAFFMPVEDCKRKLGVLASYCREIGRNPNDIRKSLIIEPAVGETEAEARERGRGLASDRNMDIPSFLQQAMVGTPEQCIEQLLPYLELGVSDFIIAARPPVDKKALELVARTIAPALKEQTQRG